MTAAGTAVIAAAGAHGETAPARRLTTEAAALWQKFPPRVPVARWPATLAGRDIVACDAMGRPYAAAAPWHSAALDIARNGTRYAPPAVAGPALGCPGPGRGRRPGLFARVDAQDHPDRGLRGSAGFP